MQIQTLNNIPITVLTEAYNQAFSDYLVPVQLNESQLQENFIRDDVDLNYSVGAFSDGKLIGFVLNALGPWKNKETAYNAGTGVFPAHRGQKLTQQMYAYILPKFQEAGVEQCLLEVIINNVSAIKTYEALNFKISRSFNCYRGAVKPVAVRINKNEVEFREVPDLDWDLAQSFWKYSPSWQHNIAGIERNKSNNKILGVFVNDLLVGYGIVQSARGKVIQFGLAENQRGKGYGHLLFQEMARVSQMPLSIFNIDQASHGTNAFLTAIGFSESIRQYEMIKLL